MIVWAARSRFFLYGRIWYANGEVPGTTYDPSINGWIEQELFDGSVSSTVATTLVRALKPLLSDTVCCEIYPFNREVLRLSI